MQWAITSLLSFLRFSDLFSCALPDETRSLYIFILCTIVSLQHFFMFRTGQYRNVSHYTSYVRSWYTYHISCDQQLYRTRQWPVFLMELINSIALIIWFLAVYKPTTDQKVRAWPHGHNLNFNPLDRPIMQLQSIIFSVGAYSRVDF